MNVALKSMYLKQTSQPTSDTVPGDENNWSLNMDYLRGNQAFVKYATQRLVKADAIDMVNSGMKLY